MSFDPPVAPPDPPSFDPSGGGWKHTPKDRLAAMRDHAHTLSDFRTPTLSIECEPCGRAGRYNIAKLIAEYGDAKLPELVHTLADCPKARSQSVYDRCKVVYSKDSRWSTSDSIKTS